jgi:cation transport ATPase
MKETVVLDVRGLQWASEKARVEAVGGRRPGVRSVEANPVAQSARIKIDPSQTSVEQFGLVLRREIAALSMSGSSVIVAVNAVMLKRLCLPAPPIDEEPQQPADTVEGVWRASTA